MKRRPMDWRPSSIGAAWGPGDRPWARGGVLLALLATWGGCSREDVGRATPAQPEPAVRVIFPASAQVDDSTVNDFVRTTIDACTSADYERFRTLWSATEKPFTRDQFERGWQTARTIEIHAIRPMRNPKDGSILYYVHASVELAARVRHPKRDVVLLIVKRDGRWRLARAPQRVVRHVLGKDVTVRSARSPDGRTPAETSGTAEHPADKTFDSDS